MAQTMQKEQFEALLPLDGKINEYGRAESQNLNFDERRPHTRVTTVIRVQLAVLYGLVIVLTSVLIVLAKSNFGCSDPSLALWCKSIVTIKEFVLISASQLRQMK